MNIRTLCTLALATTLLGCPGGDPTETTDPTDTNRTEDILGLTGAPASGATLYTDNCASCHAADGSGGIGPDLSLVVPPMSEENLVDLLLDGSGSMPSSASLEDQQLADIVSYVLQEWGTAN